MAETTIFNWALGTATAAFGGLLGLVWANNGGRIKKLEDCKVDRMVCELKHESMLNEMREIKESQKEMGETLKKISINLAVRNGFDKGRKEAEIT
jgi:hypothetical protein